MQSDKPVIQGGYQPKSTRGAGHCCASGVPVRYTKVGFVARSTGVDVVAQEGVLCILSDDGKEDVASAARMASPESDRASCPYARRGMQTKYSRRCADASRDEMRAMGAGGGQGRGAGHGTD